MILKHSKLFNTMKYSRDEFITFVVKKLNIDSKYFIDIDYSSIYDVNTIYHLSSYIINPIIQKKYIDIITNNILKLDKEWIDFFKNDELYKTDLTTYYNYDKCLCIKEILQYNNVINIDYVYFSIELLTKNEVKEFDIVLLLKNGNVKCLEYACDNGYLLDDDTCAHAAVYNNLPCLKYAFEHGAIWNKWTCHYAALYGNLDCLKYAHSNNCPWDIMTSHYAAKSGNLDCLKYAHEHGCPMDNNTCYNAVQDGSLDCLKYAIENGCSWDSATYDYALKYNYFECINYLKKNKCYWGKWSCHYSPLYYHFICFKNAFMNACK